MIVNSMQFCRFWMTKIVLDCSALIRMWNNGLRIREKRQCLTLMRSMRSFSEPKKVFRSSERGEQNLNQVFNLRCKNKTYAKAVSGVNSSLNNSFVRKSRNVIINHALSRFPYTICGSNWILPSWAFWTSSRIGVDQTLIWYITSWRFFIRGCYNVDSTNDKSQLDLTKTIITVFSHRSNYN